MTFDTKIPKLDLNSEEEEGEEEGGGGGGGNVKLMKSIVKHMFLCHVEFSNYDVGVASTEKLHVLTSSPNMISSMIARIPRN
jgi:hypothetical protein